jgi:hypothetical protein
MKPDNDFSPTFAIENQTGSSNWNWSLGRCHRKLLSGITFFIN